MAKAAPRRATRAKPPAAAKAPDEPRVDARPLWKAINWIVVIEVMGIFIGAVGVWASFAALNVANETRRDQLIAAARTDLLSAPATVNEMGPRLQNYLDLGLSLEGVEFECELVGQHCAKAKTFTSVAFGTPGQVAGALSDVTFRSVILRSPRFDGISARRAQFQRTYFDGGKFLNCQLYTAVFYEVVFNNTVFDCEIVGASFLGAQLDTVSFMSSTLDRIDVSGAILCTDTDRCVDMTPEQSRAMYYFADNPPVGDDMLRPDLWPTECPKGVGDGEVLASAQVCRSIAADAEGT